MRTQHPSKPHINPLLVLAAAALLLASLACNFGEEKPIWTPEAPRQYTAETSPVDAYVVVDAAGNVVDFDDPAYAYGANAKLRYVLRFWDIGQLGGTGYETATIHKAYTPYAITGIKTELQEGMSEAERTEVLGRTTFPTTEVKWADLTFSGGPQGYLGGTNPDTGEEIWGYMEWREKEWEMHAVLTRDIQQDYIVIDEEPFYNWP
ncbi:MAG: hypothetical protein JW726_07690 [Anaerolineales bacterium]|nr:hypothetical protein [Anaerolineales bacterium]